MLYTEKTCGQFVEETAGKAPVPGGGSVSALAGALGAALGRMVASLTIGKKKYADVEEEMIRGIDEFLVVTTNYGGKFEVLGKFKGSWEFEEWLCSDQAFEDWEKARE